jgi:hypothetical protein
VYRSPERRAIFPEVLGAGSKGSRRPVAQSRDEAGTIDVALDLTLEVAFDALKRELRPGQTFAHLAGIALPVLPQESIMPEGTWRELYKAAVLELIPELLRIRVKIAEDAINARLADPKIPRAERKEIEDALSALRRLKRLKD